MMRSWDSRDDTFVCDEPFYAHYLESTGADHPGRDEVIAAHESRWEKVVEWLTGDIPDGKDIFFQKHMAHHLLPHMDRGWLRDVESVFLIRDPGEMLTSLIKVTPQIRIEDTGLPQQWELFDRMRAARGQLPPVLDARDVLDDPAAMLGQLCSRLGVPFTDAMLGWEAGHRKSDGVWAKYWYAAVERSTGFRPYKRKPDRVPDTLHSLHEECQRYYDRLYEHRMHGKEAS